MTTDEEKKVQESILATTMALTILIGWLKGKGLWEEAAKACELEKLISIATLPPHEHK